MKFEIFKPHALFEQGKVSMQADSIFPAMGEATIHDRLFVVADGMGELCIIVVRLRQGSRSAGYHFTQQGE